MLFQLLISRIISHKNRNKEIYFPSRSNQSKTFEFRLRRFFAQNNRKEQHEILFQKRTTRLFAYLFLPAPSRLVRNRSVLLPSHVNEKGGRRDGDTRFPHISSRKKRNGNNKRDYSAALTSSFYSGNAVSFVRTSFIVKWVPLLLHLPFSSVIFCISFEKRNCCQKHDFRRKSKIPHFNIIFSNIF